MNKKDCLDLLFHSYSAITTVRAFLSPCNVSAKQITEMYQ